jgi:transcriptional regulator with XRE-family HTH domain
MDRPIDVSALYGALDSKRNAERMSWRELARELDLSPSLFTRLAQGRQPELNSYLSMTEWLNVSTEDFVDRPDRPKTQSPDTVGAIEAFLRADTKLKPESAKAITKIVKAAYDEMAEGK